MFTLKLGVYIYFFLIDANKHHQVAKSVKLSKIKSNTFLTML